MKKSNRELKPGDFATTDFNGTKTRVQIVAVDLATNSQSKVLYRVRPSLKGGSRETWYDADWFKVE